MTDPRPSLDARALAALAGEVEHLDHRIGEVSTTATEAATSAAAAHSAIQSLAASLPALLADAARQADGDDDDAPRKPGEPWLVQPDTEAGRADLRRLVEWLGKVYLHYHDAVLSACWMWHPGVVAELMALRDGWAAAHYGERKSAVAVMDWHDRYRPGAVSRVTKELKDCSLAQHAPGADRPYRPPTVPGTDLGEPLADWWVETHGASAPPSPTPDMLAIEKAEFSARARTRR